MDREFRLLPSWRWLVAGVFTAALAGCAPLPQAGDGEPDANALVTTPAAQAPDQAPAQARRDGQRAGRAARKPAPAPAASEPSGSAADAAAMPSDEAPDSDNPEFALIPSRDSDQQGLASWYGPGLHGRLTASGERFDKQELTAAHRSLAFGSRVCVRSAVTGKTVVVRINDRGPFAPGRVIDLSQAAAQELGMVGLGIKPVELWQLEEGEEECPEKLVMAQEAEPAPQASASQAKPSRAKASQARAPVSSTRTAAARRTTGKPVVKAASAATRVR